MSITPHSVPRSENDLPTELHLSRIVGGSGHGAKARAEHVAVRYAENRMIEDVKGFGAELEYSFSPERERSNDRGVERDVALRSKSISPGVAKGVERRQ